MSNGRTQLALFPRATYLNKIHMRFFLIITSWLLAHAAPALASFPIAAGDISRPECVDAMTLAKAMFASPAQHLYAPLEIPEGMRSRLVLGASELDISGGDSLEGSPEFEKVPQKDPGNRSIYWAKSPNAGRRIVVREVPFGWRGDMYSLYLLDEAIQQPSFLSGLESDRDESSRAPVVADAWRPPLVFQLDQSASKWFIDVGQPYEILASWVVYGAASAKPFCTIAFRPENPIKLLPEPVQAIARKLDEALGPGNDEGTLQPTARQRLHAKHVLANAALRPWALSDADAYNSRSEVDAGLESWARVARSRLELHREILRIYPVAERSLASYYTNAFGLPAQSSQEMATEVLDLIFRSYFVFSSEAD